MFSRWTDAELTTATARARTAKQFSEYNAPDAVVEWNNGKQWVVDFKCMPGNGVKIIDRLNDAYEQADYAIIKVQQLKTEQEDKIHRWFMQHRSFKGIFVYVEEMLRVECTR